MNKIKPFKIIQPGTQKFIQEARKTPGYKLFDFIHGYIYARWPYFYIGVGTGTHPLSKKIAPIADIILHFFTGKKTTSKDSAKNLGWTIAQTYHGKVMPLESARQLIQVKENIRLDNLEKIIPYPRARDLILQNPDHVVALECPCRAGRENPCLPLDVCLIVGEPFTSFVMGHHPKRARWISQSEAVSILEQEHARGHVHHAFFKDAMLLRYFAICNCCPCCCGAMQAFQNGVPMLASSGYIAHVDTEDCLACAECESACPFEAIKVEEYSEINTQRCMGCGVCVSRCPQNAIILQRDPSKGEPLAIIELLNQVSQAR